MIYHDTQTIVIIIILLHSGMSYFGSILQTLFNQYAVPNGKTRTKILFLKNKERIDLGMACVTPPLKKAKKEGEMPLPSLGLISLKNLGMVVVVVEEEEEEEFFFQRSVSQLPCTHRRSVSQLLCTQSYVCGYFCELLGSIILSACLV